MTATKGIKTTVIPVSSSHALVRKSELDPSRFIAEGHGEAHPLVPNDSRENRTMNRRVEMILRKL